MDLVRRGDFERAWRLTDQMRAHTRRFGDPTVPRHLQQVWNGTSLAGRRVLVRCYHGLGDTVQFARYLPRLCSIAQDVILWAQPGLLPILRTLDADVTLLPLHDGTPEADFDVDIEIMELAYAFRTTIATIPAVVPYLNAPPAPLRATPGPQIGLVWRAGDPGDPRSLALDQLSPLLDDTAMSWYALQVDRRDDERHPRLQPVDLGAVRETAAYMRAMDLVISVDSLPAHLAGALGVPVWTLLPHEADWRWMESRADSPWYPTMRLFRQRKPGDWRDVIEDVRRALDSPTAG